MGEWRGSFYFNLLCFTRGGPIRNNVIACTPDGYNGADVGLGIMRIVGYGEEEEYGDWGDDEDYEEEEEDYEDEYYEE